MVSPLDPVNSTDYADIHYAGVSYLPGSPSNINNDLIFFGVASWGDWSTPDEVAYDICVDTNEDGIYDRSLVDTPLRRSSSPERQLNDTFVRVVQNLVHGQVSAFSGWRLPSTSSGLRSSTRRSTSTT